MKISKTGIIIIYQINTIDLPTRQQAILDAIIILDDMAFLDSGTIDIPGWISDHMATYIRLPLSHRHYLTYSRPVWLYKRANFESLRRKVAEFYWSCLLQGTLDDAYELFTSSFLFFVKQSIQPQTLTIRENDKPWYDSEIRSCSRKRDKQKKEGNK